MNIFLIIAGSLSSIAALAHLGCIYFGAPWYRFFGAGERMATLAEQGSIQPTLITSGITFVLFIWAMYAFSGAGILIRLPFIRFVLVIITFVYLVRGIAGFFLITSPMGNTPQFWFWSSAICLSIGIIHLVGLQKQWTSL